MGPFPEDLMQSVSDYVRALTDEPVMAVAVLTGDKDEDWLAVAVAKSPDQSDEEVVALLIHSLVAQRPRSQG